MTAKPKSVVAISATFTAEPLSESLQFWVERLELPLTIAHAAYNQVFQTLLDSTGMFATNNEAGVNAVLFRWQDLGEDEQQIASNASSLIETLTASDGHLKAPMVVLSCPSSPIFLEQPTYAALAARLDGRLDEILTGISNIHVLDVSTLGDSYSVSEIHNSLGERLGEIPYTSQFFAALGTLLARKIVALRRPPHKVIAVDLDNTLWAGVVGEEGAGRVSLASPYLKLQEFLLKQRADGMLLTICSKNNEADAWEVFERRPEMLLKREHFAAWRINWDPKSTNLRSMAKELSLGLESFIFIDDDAKECSEVKANIPEALTLRLPEVAQDIPRFVQHVWAFDRANVTEADRKRSESYQQERERIAATQNATSLEDFIEALDLHVTIEPLRTHLIARVAQLTQRTNQFNTTTIRRTEAEIKTLLDSGRLECITVAVKDRFGDYGNVGATLYTFDSTSLVVDSMMLSCRVLGRGVEHQMVRYLGEEAKLHNVPEVVIRFIASPKNAPAFRFLDGLGAQWGSGGAYIRAFRMSAESARQLNYKPVSYTGGVEEEEKETQQPNRTQLHTIDYPAIAVRLNTADAIRDEIRASKVGIEPALTANGPVAHRNQRESKLASIWAEVLQIPAVAIHDNFFELGGDSLRAVELLIRISEEFDVPDLMLSMVLDAPTVAQFAASLGDRKQVRCLVALRETGTRPPIFCVPGGGGNVLYFRNLAMNLPEDQPFWALQAPGLDGSETVDDAKVIASMYIDEIRTIQPRGPYYLGGASYGGNIALEMAQQLTLGGEEVAFLGLFDTYNLAYGKMIPRTKVIFCHTRFFVQRASASLAKLATTSPKNWPRYFRDAVRASMMLAGRVLKIIISEPPNQKQTRPAGPVRRLDDNPNEVVDVLEKVLKSNMLAVERYVPQPYPGLITLFRATVGLVEPYQDKYLGWEPVARGGIELEIIPGRHSQFDTRLLANALDRHLRRVQKRVPSAESFVGAS